MLNLGGGLGWGGGRRFKKEGAYVYSWLIHIVVGQKPTQHCKTTIFQLKNKTKHKMDSHSKLDFDLKTVDSTHSLRGHKNFYHLHNETFWGAQEISFRLF